MRKSFLHILFILISLTAFSTPAFATFELNIQPFTGGQDIRFEPAGPGGVLRNEEVTFNIYSDQNAQYRLIQQMYQPLTNETGQTIPQGSFVMFSPSSSTLGLLRTQLETPVSMGQQPIYNSNATGQSDNFVLVYNVRVPDHQPSGIYRTRLTYTLELLSPQSGVSARTVTIDVRVEIRSTFQLNIASAKGGKNLNLGTLSQRKPTTSEVLKFQTDSNIGTTYRIVQQLTEPILSQDGTILNEQTLVFQSAGASKGTLPAAGAAMSVSETPQIVYTSNPGGFSDQFEIQYSIASTATQKAGVYSGTLSFKVESNSIQVKEEIINIPIRIEIEPIFYLNVETTEGAGIHLGSFRDRGVSKNSTVNLTVHSNLSEPYQISQVVSRKLTNLEGSTIGDENFVYSTANAETGRLMATSPVPVKEGDTVLFTSDNKGTPEAFEVNYSLKVPKDAPAGKYSSEIRYSATTL